MREAGGRHFVDAVVGVRADAAIGQGHAVADSVEAAVRGALPGSDVVVHVEPDGTAADLRERASGAALTVRGVREVHNVLVSTVDGARRELSLHLKLPAHLSLDEAHAVATRVEQAILAAAPEIDDVHTHIEPLAGGEADVAEAGAELRHVDAVVRGVVRERTGRAPRDVRLRRDERGVVALVAVTLPAGAPLGAAHEAATQIEREIRRAAPVVVEAVIHTEPA
ncbi:MAG TPA: cation transporter dimerization domain-containing protein [Solirubrobacteraceae bacterium]|nr:cation transporter dimerization domain-containing protein [Solirubrobacteraceae bacterium]